jgi:hypothetical protein
MHEMNRPRNISARKGSQPRKYLILAYQKAREASFSTYTYLAYLRKSLMLRGGNHRWKKRTQNRKCQCVKETLLVVFRLVEEEVGGELFVLVTGEIGLNGLVPRKS